MAQKAKDETEKAQEETEKQLQNLMNELSNTIGDNIEGPTEWAQNEDGSITDGKGNTLRIGDYVDYSCKSSTATYTSPKEKTGHTGDQVFRANAYDYGWRVLGVDKNTKQLQLISEDFVPLTGGGDRGNRTGQYYYLSGQNGYVNGVEELNKICSIYGTGDGATGARSVTVDDIDWITGYNPNNTGVKDKEKTGRGTKYRVNQVDEYGNNVKYTLLSTAVKYEPTNSASSGTNASYKQFTYYDEASKTWKSLATNGSVTLKSNIYSYYPTTLTEANDINAKVGIANTSPEYKMLFTNSSTGADTANNGNTKDFHYWLDSSFVYTRSGDVIYGLYYIDSGYIYSYFLYDSDGTMGTPYYGVRPVVNLDSKVTLKDSGTNKDGCKLYNMTVNK